MHQTGPARVRFFDRGGGQSSAPYASLNVGTNVGDDPELVAENRRLVALAMGVSPANLIFANQCHGNEVATVAGPLAEGVLNVDALVTTRPELALAIYTADCIPVALTAHRGVAMAHAGWRGVASHVAMRAAEVLAGEADCSLLEVSAHIGPAIGPCCFSVGADVAATLATALPYFSDHSRPVPGETLTGRMQVDLAGLVAASLVAAGLREAAVKLTRKCTMCRPEFFSHRRDGPRTGRQANVVVLTNSSTVDGSVKYI